MRPLAFLEPGPWGPRVWLGTLSLAASASLMIGTAGASPDAPAQGAHHVRLDMSSQHHKGKPKHQTKAQKGKTQQSSSRPCLEGNWKVTSITLSTTGLTFTGGTGTTVDIMANGNALGNFTPGTPLVGSEGSAKFSGTVTDHYGFSPKTTSNSGAFPVSTVTDDATITVAGVTKPVASSPEQGSYTCTGKDLSVTFTSGGNTLTYQMLPAG
ncbi:MAG TPA: hypothetical protein VGG09_15815 [Acidimicrobiales bacterium]